jgi:RNA polymerase sigma factor (sigma-70 family)
MRFGVTADEADDVAQEAALALHRTGSVLDRRALTWGIVKCKAANYYRSLRRWRRATEAAAAETQTHAQPAPSAEERMSAHDSSVMLSRALEELKSAAPELHAVLVLSMDGLIATEIAAALGLSYGTADGRLRRARATVRAQMDRWTAENAHRERWAQLTKGAPRRWR